MPIVSSSLVAVGLTGLVIAVAMSEVRSRKSVRHRLLDDCRRALDEERVRIDRGGYPCLAGRRSGRPVLVELVPDTLTIRRLPQLWLSVTLFAPMAGSPSLAVLVRPAGTEFYSLTARFHHRIETPDGFPPEVMLRGSDARARSLTERLAKPMAAILANPRVKEVAITERGLRIIRQADEGRRGEHLILRQAVFDRPPVSASSLERVLADLETLYAAATAPGSITP